MSTDYKIEVDMTPHNGYYSWVIIDVTDDSEWVNERFGWAKTPGIAWSDAYHAYLELVEGRTEGV